MTSQPTDRSTRILENRRPGLRYLIYAPIAAVIYVPAELAIDESGFVVGGILAALALILVGYLLAGLFYLASGIGRTH